MCMYDLSCYTYRDKDSTVCSGLTLCDSFKFWGSFFLEGVNPICLPTAWSCLRTKQEKEWSLFLAPFPDCLERYFHAQDTGWNLEPSRSLLTWLEYTIFGCFWNKAWGEKKKFCLWVANESSSRELVILSQPLHINSCVMMFMWVLTDVSVPLGIKSWSVLNLVTKHSPRAHLSERSQSSSAAQFHVQHV